MSIKPLFIPLKTKYYEAFEQGRKDEEYRLYGSRWNEKTCYIGRAVTLSKGYGKQNRLKGTITGFQRLSGEHLKPQTQQSLQSLYPGKNDFAAIEIRLEEVNHAK